MWLMKHISIYVLRYTEGTLMKWFSVYYNLENECTELMSANGVIFRKGKWKLFAYIVLNTSIRCVFR